MTQPVGIDTAKAVGIDEADVAGMDQPQDFLPQMSREDFAGLSQGQRLVSFDSTTTTAPPSGATGLRQKIVDEAQKFQGLQYVWGGTDPSKGFDCSGFVQYVYGRMGIDLPRLSSQQAIYGKRIGLNALQAGDLVAWNVNARNGGPEAEHIAIYLGNGMIAESPKPGTPNRIRKLGSNEGDAWGVQMNL